MALTIDILAEHPISCKEVFDRLGRTGTTMVRIIKGQTGCPPLEACKLGGRWVTTREAVERWVEACDDREATSSPDRTRRRRSDGALAATKSAPKGGAE